MSAVEPGSPGQVFDPPGEQLFLTEISPRLRRHLRLAHDNAGAGVPAEDGAVVLRRADPGGLVVVLIASRSQP